ncbi:hypothetical protein NE865_14353 [Phthorimaea operculella]|nr:hypothetical protein NE865_14353 [Phthorimaea operculella]
MSAPENVEEEIIQNDVKTEEKKKDGSRKKHNKLPIEGSGSLELNLYSSAKTWKKSITHFFRNQLRSTKSNDGDGPSGSSAKFPAAAVSPEQKWQSLGKVFRRQHAHLDAWTKDAPDEQPQKKSAAIKKVLSSYFSKNSKALTPVADEK